MTEDRRAHERIDSLQEAVEKHLVDHSKFEADLKKNTSLTQEIADNTSELVALFKGIKGFRALLIWGAPVVAIFAAIIVYIREWK